MLGLSRLLVIIALTGVCAADNVTFLRIDQTVVEQRIQTPPASAAQRLQTLRNQFLKAGCQPSQIIEQPVTGQALPNLLCVVHGTELGTVVVAARFEYDPRGDEGAVGWSGLAMLPLLAESLLSTAHRHTFVFAAFTGGDSLAGSAYFLKQLSDSQRRDLRGMVDLDHLGRTSAGYAADHDNVMTRLLPAAARALQSRDLPAPISGVPDSDALNFERAHIPAITIFSPGYQIVGADQSAKLTPTADAIAPNFRRAAPAPSAPVSSYALKTTVDPGVYNSTYNLLCVYLLFLDRGLPASRRSAPEVLQAQNNASSQPSVATSQPAAVATPPSASASLNASPPVTLAANVAPPPPPAATPAQPEVKPVAQTTPPPGTSVGPTFKTTARLVQVDVVVTDGKGQPIHGLSQSDFTILEDGKPQNVRAFEAHSQTLSAPAQSTGPRVAATSAAQSSQPHTYSNIPPRESSANWTVVLFDLLNTPGPDQAYARSQLLQLLKSVPAGQPTALFVLTQHLEMMQGFTQDPARLVEIAELLTPGKSQLLTTRVEQERTMAEIGNEARLAQPTASVQGAGVDTSGMAYGMASRLEQGYKDNEAFRSTDRVLFTLEAMKGIARAVSGYPGRKNLLWMSGSFPVQIEPDPFSQDEFRNMRGFEAAISSAGALLATSRVAVYPIDVRGLQSRGIDISIASTENQTSNEVLPSTSAAHGVTSTSTSTLGSTLTQQSVAAADERSTMKRIAEQTGGEAFINTNDLKRAMQRSLEDGTTYYTLAYTPPKEGSGGGYHHIQVKVEHPGAKLSYRRGYYLVPNPSTAATGTATLRTALQPGMPPATMLSLTASVQPPDASHKDTRVDYILGGSEITFADVPDQKKRAQVDFMVIAFDRDGREVAHASDTLDATIPASAYDTVLSRGLPAHQLIALPPGIYNLRIGAMDRATQQIGTVDAPLVIAGPAVAQK